MQVSKVGAEDASLPADRRNAEHACAPIVKGDLNICELGELGWEYPRMPTGNSVNAAHAENAEPTLTHERLATNASHGHEPHVSHERVKASPSSARPSPLGTGSSTAHAVRADECTNGLAPRD